jgi:hypothetical protein
MRMRVLFILPPSWGGAFVSFTSARCYKSHRWRLGVGWRGKS